MFQQKQHSDKLRKYKSMDIKHQCCIGFYGTITIGSDMTRIEECCAQILQEVSCSSESEVPIAWDMEWPFSYSKGSGPTALIQMCKDLNMCYIFQVSRLQGKLPEGLILLLGNPKIVFHGVKVRNDFRKLYRDFGDPRILEQVTRSVELGSMFNSIKGLKRNWSLANLAKELINANLNKEFTLRASQWDNIVLSPDQQMYAAVDVYVGQLIYKKLKRLQRQEKLEN